MGKQHLIALDLDGTLLTGKQEISSHTKKILAKAIEEGHIVIIATGRSYRTSILYYRMLGLDTAIVNFNGAYIHHPKMKKWDAQHSPIPLKTALEIIDTSSRSNVQNMIVKVQSNIYIEKHDEHIMSIFQSLSTDKEFPPLSIGNIKDKLKGDPTSILVIPNKEDIVTFRSGLTEHYADTVDHRLWGTPNQITEITKKGIHKAVGVKKVAEYYNIPRERIIAFGDENNDLEMIDYVGIGVAMENGISELKSVANHVTTSNNNDDGVGKFLESYLNLKVTVS